MAQELKNVCPGEREPATGELMSEADVILRRPLLAPSSLLKACKTGQIGWTKGKRNSAWYRLCEPKTSRTSLAVVLHKYFDERTDKLPSAKNARLAGRTLLSFWGETVRVEAITEAKQKEFAEWSIQQGHSLGYISRNFSVLSAALSFSKLDRKIIFKEAVMVERWALGAKARAKRLTLSDEELARFLAAEVPKGIWRWCLISLLTGARPAAALELTPAQRNRDSGTLDLNPAGRRQSKKYRANVREPLALKAWLDSWEVEMREERAKREKIANPDISRDTYCGYASLESVQSKMGRIYRCC